MERKKRLGVAAVDEARKRQRLEETSRQQQVMQLPQGVLQQPQPLVAHPQPLIPQGQGLMAQPQPLFQMPMGSTQTVSVVPMPPVPNRTKQNLALFERSRSAMFGSL